MGWLTDLNKDHTTIYTDGSCCSHLGYVGGWAAIIRTGTELVEMSGATKPTTNNRMEMTAALKALASLPSGSRVTLYTDSKYLQKGIQYWIAGWQRNGWQTGIGEVVNRDLWEALEEENNRHVVSWLWVRGHNGDPHNERCDFLAKLARTQLHENLLLTNQQV